MSRITKLASSILVLRLLTLVTAVVTYVLVIVGGIVRVSNSGLGCPDWPLCHGQAVPLAQLHDATLIEFSHRAISALATVLIVSTIILAWRRYRNNQLIFRPVVLAAGLLVLQILLGGITVLLDLPALIVSVHLSNALFLFAALVVAAVNAHKQNHQAPSPAGRVARRRLWRLALASTCGTFLLIVSGTIVVGTASSSACLSNWPLCNGQLIPAYSGAQVINMLHRYIASALGPLVIYTFVIAWHAQPQLRASVAAGATLFSAQVAVGALNVALGFPLIAGILHLALAAALWASMITFTTLVYHAGAISKPAVQSAPAPQAHPISAR